MKREDFVKEIEKEYENHSVYIGTGNGEQLYGLTIGDIVRMEEDYGDEPKRRANQVLTFIGSQIGAGVNLSKARAEDCSGMVVGALRRLGLITIATDYRARDFQNTKTDPVALIDLLPGDLVFNREKDATHMGVYVGEGMTIESQGRTKGVIKRKLSAGAWVTGGRLPYWEDPAEVIFHRNLKYIKGNQMRGEDVKALQDKLASLSLYADTIDGSFGKNTKAAVEQYQKIQGIAVDGIAGRTTLGMLGFTYR